MFTLNDELIEAAIDSIVGFVVAKVATDTENSLCEVAEAFYSSETYKLLSNKETGYYWDSIPELVDMFYKETCLLKK